MLEAYLLDFAGDLYGEPGRVRFARRLRDEVRFDSAAALSAQVAADVDRHPRGPRRPAEPVTRTGP